MQFVFGSKCFYFKFIGDVAMSDSPRNNQHQYGEVIYFLKY